MKEFRTILSFFTRIPVGNLEFSEGLFEKSFKWTTVVGVLIGVILGGLAYVLRYTKEPIVEGFILMILYIIITGALHLDGLADTCDGIFSGRSKERVIEIMKDSRIGSFGVISLIIVLLGYTVLLGRCSLLAIVAFPVVGKTMLHIASKSSYYCKGFGMGKAFIEEGGRKNCLIIATMINLILTAISIYFREYAIVVSGVITYIICYFIIKNIEKKIDGISGDILGFIAEVSQLLFLIIIIIVTPLMDKLFM